MKRRFIVCLLLALLIFPFNSMATQSFYSNGNVDNSDGTSNKYLVFRDFDIIPDGFIIGYIMNNSNHTLKSVRLDVWTADKGETRIIWRKILDIGDMAAGAKFQIRAPYPSSDDNVVYKFKFTSPANFRNSKIKD